MKIHDCAQGSQEWLMLRSGIPTASEFDSILTRGGKKSESRERYMLTLLAERVMGHPCAEHITMWMDRGKEMEKQAVSFYEFQRDTTTTAVGFITNDQETCGASPDRLVEIRGMLETKVPSEWVHMGYLLKSGKAYDKYMVQVQGQLLVVEDRDWTDILSFHPELPPAIIRIERDLQFQSLLAEAVAEFSAALELAWSGLVADGLTARPARQQPSEQERLIQALKESLVEIKG